MAHSHPDTQTSSTATAVPSDDDLASQAQKDPHAFGQIYQRYAVRVYRFVYGKVGDAAEAEDITSQSFFDALQSLPRYRPRGVFAAWLFAIVRRRCADHFRQRARAGTMTDPKVAHTGHEDEIVTDLDDLLATLTARERELLALRYAGELSYREIGQLVGKSEAAAKMAVTRIVHRLKAYWELRDG